jgi:hypothetical protein
VSYLSIVVVGDVIVDAQFFLSLLNKRLKEQKSNVDLCQTSERALKVNVVRVARLFLTQNTKMGENITNNHNIT